MRLVVGSQHAGSVLLPCGVKTRIEPAGAGGATGASHQLRRHQLGRGGKVAPQSPLEESATTSARWHGNDQLPLQNSVQVPVFE